jgi:hypothetical protein
MLYPRIAPIVLVTALLLTACGRSEKQAKATPLTPAPAPVPEPTPEPVAPAPETSKFAKAGAKAPAPKLEELAAARIEGGYVTVQLKNGQRKLLPVAGLSDAELAELKTFAVANPLAKGKSSIVVAKVEVKKTIEKQETKDGTETVQLVPPAKLRDQIGGTCMLYARVHYLDIAGYPVDDAEIYKITNQFSPDTPFADPRYHTAMQVLFLKQKPTPIAYHPDGTVPPFEWARQQLRKGRPLLAALPENIWLSLPADYLATHPFEGNSKIGHQIVISGFSYNPSTKKSTFHIVNSWRILSEFDITVEARDERNISIEQSLAPRGEQPEQPPKIVAGAITLLKPVGKQNLYSVETNLGPRKVMAVSEEGAKQFVEANTAAKDMETVLGENILQSYDFIYAYADAKMRDAAAAAMIADACKVPANVAIPHIDLEVRGAVGKTYLVRVAPDKVVKLMAESTGEALEAAKRAGAGTPRS